METVYPKTFIFRREKNIPGVYDHKTYESYQLTVECNIKQDGHSALEEEDRKEKKNLVLDSSALLRRKKVFNKNLGNITRQHHKVKKHFLVSLSILYSYTLYLMPTTVLSSILNFSHFFRGFCHP